LNAFVEVIILSQFSLLKNKTVKRPTTIEKTNKNYQQASFNTHTMEEPKFTEEQIQSFKDAFHMFDKVREILLTTTTTDY
jgi:hypothetical protein